MTTVLHKAETRGHADHGWLNSHHTFSFANYHDPERMHFGALRVLNDDIVAPGKGFGLHPHDNMEIISIPLEGDLEHKDNMGNTEVIRQGDIQVMSAGTGIFHSEYNRNSDREVKFLQIWLYPKEKNVQPRYGQVTIASLEKENAFTQVVSPDQNDQGAWIHQDAWFHLGTFTSGKETTYTWKQQDNGLYVFVLGGTVSIAGQQLNARDGMGIHGVSEIDFTAVSDTRLLLMEVPMY